MYHVYSRDLGISVSTDPAPLYLRTLWRYTNAVIIIIIIIIKKEKGHNKAYVADWLQHVVEAYSRTVFETAIFAAAEFDLSAPVAGLCLRGWSMYGTLLVLWLWWVQRSSMACRNVVSAQWAGNIISLMVYANGRHSRVICRLLPRNNRCCYTAASSVHADSPAKLPTCNSIRRDAFTFPRISYALYGLLVR